MKANWKTLKRFLAMVMSLVMVFSCVQMGIPAHVHAVEAEPSKPGITLGEILAGNYELSEVEKEVLESGDLSAEINFKYNYELPPADTTEEDGLISVDRESKTITVQNYQDSEGNAWIPKSVTIKVNDQDMETVTLTEGVGTYTYDGNAFAVVVEYVLTAGGLLQDVTDAQQLALLNAVIYLSQDVDWMQRLDKDEAINVEAAGVISQSFTPTGFLEMMTIVNPLLGDEAPINLLYDMVAGIEETVKLPDGSQETISIKLEGNAARAAESLKAQMDANGKLDLPYFLSTHDCSYLELLYNDSYKAGLEDALNQNINDINGLLDDGGLYDLQQALTNLSSDLIRWEEQAYEMINDRIYDIIDIVGPIEGLEDEWVDDLTDLMAVQAAVQAFYDAALEDANGMLDDKVASGELNAEWVPENGINSAADLKALMDTVQGLYDDGLAEINTLLQTKGQEYGISFPVVKESMHIQYVRDEIDEYLANNLNTLNKTVAQYNDAYGLALPSVSYTGLDRLDQTATDVAKLQNALAEAKEMLDNAVDSMNSTLDSMGYEGADVKTSGDIDAVILPWQNAVRDEENTIALQGIEMEKALGAVELLLQTSGITYNNPITDSEDIDAVVTYLSGLAGDELADANALVVEKQAAVNAILKTINNRLAVYYYDKTVTKSADVDVATTFMRRSAAANIWNKVNTELASAGVVGFTINSVQEAEDAKVTASLILSGENYELLVEKLDEAIRRVNNVNTVRAELEADKVQLQAAEAELKTAQDAVSNAGGEIAELISNIRQEQTKYNNANVLKTEAETRKAAYEAKIDAANGLRGQLDTVNNALLQLPDAEEMLAKLYAVLVSAPEMLAQLDEAEAMMKQAENALEMLDEYHAAMQEAEAQINTLNEAVEALATLDSYKSDLDLYQMALPMLNSAFSSFVSYLRPLANRFKNNRWTVQENVNANADFDALTDAAERMIGTSVYTKKFLKSADNLYITSGTTKLNMSMYNVEVVYAAAIVNPLLVDSNELYDLTSYKTTITLEKGASAEQIMAAIQNLNAEPVALESWAGYKINATDFVRAETELPETLESNITYKVSYTPKELNLTYQGMTGPATVLFGHTMSLPVCETEGREYTYRINGILYYQGQSVTLLKDSTIIRTEADASTDSNLLDVVVNATSVNDAVKKILSSSAISYAESIKIRFPSAALLNVNTDEKILTASKYENAVGSKAWVALSAVTKDVNGDVLENLNSFENDQVAYSQDFAIADVLYQIAFTASDANTTDAKVLAAMNFANTLLDDYQAQKEALDYLSSDSLMNALAMLDGNDTTITGYLSMAGTVLGGDPAKNALDVIIKDLNSSDNGKLKLYNELFNYKEQGMAYYYKNDVMLRNELSKMQGAMATLTSSDKFMNLVAENSYDLYLKLLSIKDSLLAASIPAKSANISTADDAALKQLIADLESYAQVGKTVYTSVGELKWTTTLSATVGVKIVSINVKFGAQTATLKLTFTEGNTLDQADIQNMLDQIAALEAEMGVDKLHYVREGELPNIGDVMDPDLSDAELTYNLNWTAKSYDIIVNGDAVGSVTYENPYFTLPTHSASDYRYDYVIGGENYTQGETVNLKADFDSLFASGSLNIQRKEVDKVREQMINFVDRMNGAVALIEHGNRQYSMVLKIDPATISGDMSNFVMGMLMSGYGYIGMDGQMFYGAEGDAAPQFHLQTLVDMIMNSGLGTQTIMDLYGAKGFNNIALSGQIISNKGGNMNALGGKLLQSTMSFGSSAEDDLEVGFYITMADNATAKQLNSAIASVQDMISVTLQNGQIEASVNLPDQVYAAYLAALSVVGEADLHSIEEINAEIALGYLFTLIDPILNDETVTTETFENTLAMFGRPTDLSGYADIYQQMRGLLSELLADRTYTDAGCTVNIENYSINAVIDWVQKNVIAQLAASFGVNPEDIQLSAMIYEYKSDEADEDYGLDLKLYAELTNITENYAALFIAPRAAGIANKLGMLTAEEIAAGKLATVNGMAYVILLTDINSDLVTNGTVLLDLNGKTVNGSLNAKGSVIVVDNAYQAKESGGITGAVSGKVTILDGKYSADVSAFVPEGYEQLPNGTVSNKMFTITSDGENNITVTIHTNLSSIRELADKQGVINLGLNVATELLLNHYNAAALAIGPENGELYTVFDANFADIVGLLSSDDLLTDGANTVLAGTSLSKLADLFNVITADLTDFKALSEALAGDGKIATYKTQTAAWQLDVVHVEDGDYMTLSIGSNNEKKDGSLTVVVDGALTKDLEVLFAAMGETVKVESELDLNDLMIDENGLLDVIGSYKGIIEVDFTGNRNYVVMLAVTLAHGNSSIRGDMVDAIKAYYASGETSLVDLEECFKKLSAEEMATALANHNRTKTFTQMLRDLGLYGIVDNDIGDDELGYAQLIDVLGIAIRELKARDLLDSILGSSRTLGSFQKSDEKGNYFGFSTNRTFEKVFGPVRGYSVGVNFELSELSIKLRLFAEEALVIVTDAAGARIGTFDNLEQAIALANNNPGSTVTVTGGVTLNNDLLVNTQIKLIGIKRITFADGVKILLNADNAELSADKAINEYVAVADGELHCLKIETDGNFTVYTARAHFDSANDKDHLCDYNCGTVVEGCSDSANDGDHACDVCGEIIEDCFDNNNDHICDECGATVSTCVDEDEDGYCDICGKDLDPTCDHVDSDNDHLCDLCGEIVSTCIDENNDHKCDICDEPLSECVDNDRNHKCDICGTVVSTCVDNNNDHKCDICGTVVSTCVDNNNDHKCDICGTVVSTCADNNNDHKCDLCGETLSHCSDLDNNHNCDLCGNKLSNCADDNSDHYCDLCGSKLSNCADNNSDHYCDLCGSKLSNCADNNSDHNCDLCGDKLSNCADNNNDHKCDLCGAVLSECSDAANDGDHNCDLCGKENITDCVDKNNDKYCDDCGKVLAMPTIGKPAVNLGNLLFGALVDVENKIIYLDTYREGISVEDLEALMADTVVEYDADGKVEIKVVNKNGQELLDTDRVPTAAKITLIASNAVGEATAVYSVVVIGDTNCDGQIGNTDAVLISQYYLGKKKLEGLALDAADTNRSGDIENNDAVRISVKFLRPVNYTSRLNVD